MARKKLRPPGVSPTTVCAVPGTNLRKHDSQCSSTELLQSTKESDVLMLILPSHTTPPLHPLERGIVALMKTFFGNM